MLISDISDKLEPYSSYKNRVFSKHIDKLNNQLRQIKDCSLNPNDKAKLKTKLKEILNEGSVAAPSAQKKEHYNCEYKSDNEDNRAAISA